jgi:hypothetical protein
MLMAASLLIPLALTTSPDLEIPPSYDAIRAFVTGYNTVIAQTDDTPCIAASGANICGRRDAVACPRDIDLGTVVEIRGTTYVCEDRTARKYNARFDISCDKNASCPYDVAGWTIVKIYTRVETSIAQPSGGLASQVRVNLPNATTRPRLAPAVAQAGPGLGRRLHTVAVLGRIIARVVHHQRQRLDRDQSAGKGARGDRVTRVACNKRSPTVCVSS